MVIEVLLGTGWTAEGRTPMKSVRVPTRRVPLYGKSGGEVRTSGGRARFSKGGSRRVTVGKRTTCFYQMVGGKAEGFTIVESKDIARIRELAEAP